MKRILSAMLMLCLLCGVMAITACGGEQAKAPETAYELFNAATEKSQELNCYEGVMDINMGINMMGITLNMPMVINIKAQDLKTESPKTAMDMRMDIMGQTVEIEMYSDGEWAYVVALEQSYKTSLASAQNNYSDYVGDILKELPENLLEDVPVTLNEDGTRSFEAEITSEAFKELYTDFILEMAANAMGTASGLEDITIKNAKIAASISEDLYFSKYSISFGLSLVISGVESDLQISVDLTYVDPGKEVTVEFPEGYENFIEIANQ